MFVDLCSGVSIMSVDLKESVTTLELLQDKQHQITSVMVWFVGVFAIIIAIIVNITLPLLKSHCLLVQSLPVVLLLLVLKQRAI